LHELADFIDVSADDDENATPESAGL